MELGILFLKDYAVFFLNDKICSFCSTGDVQGISFRRAYRNAYRGYYFLTIFVESLKEYVSQA